MENSPIVQFFRKEQEFKKYFSGGFSKAVSEALFNVYAEKNNFRRLVLSATSFPNFFFSQIIYLDGMRIAQVDPERQKRNKEIR